MGGKGTARCRDRFSCGSRCSSPAGRGSGENRREGASLPVSADGQPSGEVIPVEGRINCLLLLASVASAPGVRTEERAAAKFPPSNCQCASTDSGLRRGVRATSARARDPLVLAKLVSREGRALYPFLLCCKLYPYFQILGAFSKRGLFCVITRRESRRCRAHSPGRSVAVAALLDSIGCRSQYFAEDGQCSDAQSVVVVNRRYLR